jgi:effector-binding domain-containing protein
MIQTKEVKPINFLYFRAETRVDQLINFLPVGQELFREAVRLNVRITGPVHWHYIGFDGDFTKPFILEISLPVGEVPGDYDGSFHFKRTDNFKCVSITHEGAWNEIPTSYGKLMEFISDKHLTPSTVNREVYVNADFVNLEANVTEIQMGIV